MRKQSGHTSLSVNEEIISVTLSGVFNEKEALNYKALLLDAIHTLRGKPFCMLVDNTGVEGGTPEAFDVLEDINASLPGFSLIAKAYVYKSDIVMGIVKQRVLALKKINKRNFTDYQDAMDWLTSEMAQYRQRIG
ncbi:hypothetical protein [Alteromonas sp. A079]|uniref:hypothetical protein n=1 Tax=Alteromonas sp. A079 TaxID=3410268 RepID=UPI003BA1A2F2